MHLIKNDCSLLLEVVSDSFGRCQSVGAIRHRQSLVVTSCDDTERLTRRVLVHERPLWLRDSTQARAVLCVLVRRDRSISSLLVVPAPVEPVDRSAGSSSLQEYLVIERRRTCSASDSFASLSEDCSISQARQHLAREPPDRKRQTALNIPKLSRHSELSVTR